MTFVPSKQSFRTDFKRNEFFERLLIATRICHCSQENERLLCRWLSAQVDWPVTTSDPSKTEPISRCRPPSHCAGLVPPACVRACVLYEIHSYTRPAHLAFASRTSHARTRGARASSATIIVRGATGQEVATVAHVSLCAGNGNRGKRWEFAVTCLSRKRERLVFFSLNHSFVQCGVTGDMKAAELRKRISVLTCDFYFFFNSQSWI